MKHPPVIVITRAAPDNLPLQRKLECLGATVYACPAIRVMKRSLDQTIRVVMGNIAAYDWIVFTSAKGVDCFMMMANKTLKDIRILNKNKIAVVGPETAARVSRYGLSADIVSPSSTSGQLARDIRFRTGSNILLPRSAIGLPALARALRGKGGNVTDLPLYTIVSVTTPDRRLEELIEKDMIGCVTFTSPSTVAGFLERLGASPLRHAVLRLPVVTIGPTTTGATQRLGFREVYTAARHTTDGIAHYIRQLGFGFENL